MNTIHLETRPAPEVHTEALFDSAADYIFVIDQDGIISRPIGMYSKNRAMERTSF